MDLRLSTIFSTLKSENDGWDSFSDLVEEKF